MKEIFIALAYVAGVVAAPLIISVWVAGWLYRRALRRRMDLGQEPTNEAFPVAAAAPRGTATAEEVRAEAFDATRRVRRAYLMAGLAYAAVTCTWAATLYDGTIASRGQAMWAFLMPQLILITWSIRWPLWRRILLVVLYAGIGTAVLLLLWPKSPKQGLLIASYLFDFLIVPFLVLLFLFLRPLRAVATLFVAAAIEIGSIALYILLVRPGAVAGGFKDVAAHASAAGLGMANIAAGIVIAVMLLRGRRAVRLAGFAVALAGAILLDHGFVHHDLPPAVTAFGFVAVAVLEIYIVWAAFKAIASLNLTGDLMQAHLGWILLTAYFMCFAVFSTKRATATWGFAVAIVVFVAVLHLLLWSIRKSRPPEAPMRLLFLRVFRRSRAGDDVLRDLDDTWRRVGAVDLIAGTDVASRTTTSTTLEAFLLLHADEEFLKPEDDVDARLARRRLAIEMDARYPVNAVYCYRSTWQRAFARLAGGTNAVLMDLRGFSAANKWCEFELRSLLRYFDAERIVLLADDEARPEIDRIKREVAAEREPAIVARRGEVFDALLRAAL